MSDAVKDTAALAIGIERRRDERIRDALKEINNLASTWQTRKIKGTLVRDAGNLIKELESLMNTQLPDIVALKSIRVADAITQKFSWTFRSYLQQAINALRSAMTEENPKKAVDTLGMTRHYLTTLLNYELQLEREALKVAA